MLVIYVSSSTLALQNRIPHNASVFEIPRVLQIISYLWVGEWAYWLVWVEMCRANYFPHPIFKILTLLNFSFEKDSKTQNLSTKF